MKAPNLGHHVVLSALVLVFGCDDEERQQAPEAEVKWEETGLTAAVGPQFDDEDFLLVARAPKTCPTEGPMAPPNTKLRISVPVEVTAKSQRQVPVSALTFTLEDREGHEYRPTLAGCAPSLRQRTIAAGTKIAGEVAFDVPRNVGPLELRYEPFLIGRKKVTARVKVPGDE